MEESDTVNGFVIALVISFVIAGGFVLAGDSHSVESEESAFVANDSSVGTDSGFVDFQEVAFENGIRYEPQIMEMRQGVYVVDFDNDGDEDVLLMGGKNPVLYKNTGSGFAEHREFPLRLAQTAHFLDYNNDGWRDLIIAPVGDRPAFYVNENGTFERKDVGIAKATWRPMTINSADFNADGCLDVFIGQYGSGERAYQQPISEIRNNPDLRPDPEGGNENILLFGNCSVFSQVTEEAGLTGERWTLASAAVDLTGDGHIDIYVGNDFGSDYLYINRGNGTFHEHRMPRYTDRNAMSVRTIDMNGDGSLEIFITNIWIPAQATSTTGGSVYETLHAAFPYGNNYIVMNESGGFEDKAEEYGIEDGGWGWTATVADYNNDGHLDIVHGTIGSIPVEPFPKVYRTMQVWKGTEVGWTKLNGSEMGFYTENTRGMARIDYNMDGRLDIITAPSKFLYRGDTDRELYYRLYENQNTANQALQFFVRNPDGISRNANVVIQTDTQTIHRVVNSRGDFVTQDSRLVHVGMGGQSVEKVTIVWPDGENTTYTSLETGNRYILLPDEAIHVATLR